MMNLLEQAAMFLGEQDIPECKSTIDALTNLKAKLESDGCEIVDDYINSDDPSIYIKLNSGVNIKLGEVDTTIDAWDDPEAIQISVYYTENLSYPDRTEIKPWYEIDAEYLETEFAE